MDATGSQSAGPMSRTEWLVEAAALGILLFWLCYLAVNWSSLPDEVPTRFDFSGNPVALGSRSVLWVLTGLGFLVYVVLTAGSRLTRFHSFPVEVTRENASELYAFSRRFINLSKLVVIATLGYIEWKMVQTARGNADGLAPWFIPTLIAGMLALALYPVFRLRRN